MPEFKPLVSEKDLQAALAIPPESSLSKERIREIARFRSSLMIRWIGISIVGIVLGIIFIPGGLDKIQKHERHSGVYVLGGAAFFIVGISILLKALHQRGQVPSQYTPEMIAKNFYSAILSVGESSNKADWGLAYSLLSSSTWTVSGSRSVSEFRELWEEVRRAIPLIIKQIVSQTVRCGSCDKETRGLWSVKTVLTVKKSTPSFAKCDNPSCQKVFCYRCVSKLDWFQNCPCGSGRRWHTLLETKERYDEVSFVGTPIAMCEAINDKVARVYVDVQSSIQLRFSSVDETKDIKIPCRFYNMAIRIGAKWFLVSAEPGQLTKEGQPTCILTKMTDRDENEVVEQIKSGKYRLLISDAYRLGSKWQLGNMESAIPNIKKYIKTTPQEEIQVTLFLLDPEIMTTLQIEQAVEMFDESFTSNIFTKDMIVPISVENARESKVLREMKGLENPWRLDYVTDNLWRAIHENNCNELAKTIRLIPPNPPDPSVIWILMENAIKLITSVYR
jgi:hypothetical protein